MTSEITAEVVATRVAEQVRQAAVDPVADMELVHSNTTRWGCAEDVRLLRAMQPHLPELPDPQAAEVYERICAAERWLVAPHLREQDYGPGAARFPNDIVVLGSGQLLLEAQHASDPVRRATGIREAADHGTAGLTAVLALEGMGRALIPKGQQLGNANVDGPDHPMKWQIRRELAENRYAGLFSVHGMRPGKVNDMLDATEIHAVIGLGKDPREASLAAAELLVKKAKDELGLRVVVGNFEPHVNFTDDPRRGKAAFRDASDEVKVGEGARPALARLAAAGANNMATYVNRLTDAMPDFRVLQIEMSRSLRLTPSDQWVRPGGRSAERMGVYLGYLFGKMAAQVAAHGMIEP